MLDHQQILDRIPHGGPMCLLERVSVWDEDHIVAHAFFDSERPHPLAVDGGLPMTALAEYGAQAMAIHGHLLAGSHQPVRSGLLVALARLELAGEKLESSSKLQVFAQRLAGDENGQVYQFTVAAPQGNLLARGRATVMFADGNNNRSRQP